MQGFMSTTLLKKSEVKRGWFIADATDQSLGRLAARIATVLMGKHKVAYTPHADCGDYVIVTNVGKIKVDARSKWKTKVYQRYTFYPSGQKNIPFFTMLDQHPDRVLMLAVRRMLPKNKIARKMITRLKSFRTADHPHANHRPAPLK